MHSANRRVIHMEEFDTVYDEAMDKIKQDFEAYIGEQSGWVLDEISSINLNIARYKPIRGTSYTETHRALSGKNGIVNMKNDDLYCFLWCILAYLYHVAKDPQRVNKYEQYLDKLDYKGIKMPIAVKDIDRFEKMNNLAINVYGCSTNGSEIWPRKISNRRDNKVING